MPTTLPVDRAMRDRIRAALKDHKASFEPPRSNGKIEAFIDDHQAELGGTISAETIGRFFDMSDGAITISERHVLLLGRYLEMVSPDIFQFKVDKLATVTPGSPTQPAHEPFHDPNFKTLCEQFQIDDRRVAELAEEYSGTYEFYAHSEDTPPDVVYGAITLLQHSKNTGKHRKTMALLAREVQRGRKPRDKDGKEIKSARHRAFERWVGYFLESEHTCVIFEQSRSLYIPKVYVLRPERRERGTRRVTTMRGRMLKVGTNGGVFTSRIVMFRNSDAYGNCDLMPFKDCSPEIQAALGDPG